MSVAYTKYRMKIGRIFYPVKVLGYGKRVGIWTCGCNKNCYKCMSPELKDMSNAVEYSVDRIIEFISGISGKIDGITISGGEPFLQPDELALLIAELNNMGIKDIIIYTGYSYEYLCSLGKKEHYILNNISVLIDGEFVDELNDGLGIRGSVNQNIYIFRYHNRYKDINQCERQIQTVMTDSHTTFIGIPNNER